VARTRRSCQEYVPQMTWDDRGLIARLSLPDEPNHGDAHAGPAPGAFRVDRAGSSHRRASRQVGGEDPQLVPVDAHVGHGPLRQLAR
jgi:hypothetical protein